MTKKTSKTSPKKSKKIPAKTPLVKKPRALAQKPGLKLPAVLKTQSGKKELSKNKITQLVDDVKHLIVGDKGEDVVAINLAGKASFADYMVVASGRSSRQLGSIADHLRELFSKAGIAPVRIEGAGAGDWVVVDGLDIVVHLFRPEVREYYQLEKMWQVPAGRTATKTASAKRR